MQKRTSCVNMCILSLGRSGPRQQSTFHISIYVEVSRQFANVRAVFSLAVFMRLCQLLFRRPEVVQITEVNMPNISMFIEHISILELPIGVKRNDFQVKFVSLYVFPSSNTSFLGEIQRGTEKKTGRRKKNGEKSRKYAQTSVFGAVSFSQTFASVYHTHGHISSVSV